MSFAIKSLVKAAPIIAPKTSSIASPIASSISLSSGTTVMTSEEELQIITSSIESSLARKHLRKSVGVVQRMAQIVQEMRRNERVSIDQLADQMRTTSRTIDANVSMLKQLKIISTKGATRNAQWKVLI